MASKRNHSKKGRKGTRRRARRTLRMRGGGWTDNLSLPTAGVGNQIHQQYSGPGKDCAGLAVRPGTIGSLATNLNSGLPGTGSSPASRGQLGGATQLGSGGPVIMDGVPVSKGESPAPFPKVFQDIQSKLPTTTLYRSQQSQSGGRYGFEGTPLSPNNGVGMSSYGPIGRVACETGTYNALNPTAPMPQLSQGGTVGYGVQGLATAVPSLPGQTQMMKGGRRLKKKAHNAKNGKNHSKCPICHKVTRKNKQSGGMTQQPPTQKFVGDVGSMAYNAPTAGYFFEPAKPFVPNNPYEARTPYDARSGGSYSATIGYPTHFNQACLKTN
jgi:hypothetical protein